MLTELDRSASVSVPHARDRLSAGRRAGTPFSFSAVSLSPTHAHMSIQIRALSRSRCLYMAPKQTHFARARTALGKRCTATHNALHCRAQTRTHSHMRKRSPIKIPRRMRTRARAYTIERNALGAARQTPCGSRRVCLCCCTVSIVFIVLFGRVRNSDIPPHPLHPPNRSCSTCCKSTTGLLDLI